MIVMKFGGTSVKDATAIINAINIVKNRYSKAWIVVSALSGITNKLVNITESISIGNLDKTFNLLEEIKNIHLDTISKLNLSNSKTFLLNTIENLKNIIYALNIIGEVSPKSIDLILSTGEILSSYIINDYAKSIGLNSTLIDSREIIKTDSNFNAAEVNFEITKINILNVLNNNLDFDYIICGGYIGSDTNNNTTTLGRGGSDYSAAIISWALKSEKLEIWTDVSGIMTTDPRIVPNAKILKHISYQEAAELAYFGAKVLHPKTIFPAIESDIPVYVLNTFNPDCSGTKITSKTPYTNIIKSITFRKDITLINIISNRMLGAYGFLAKVFDVFNKNKTSVDLVSTSEVSVSLTIENEENLSNLINELQEFANVEVYSNMSIISAIGEGIRDTSGIVSRFMNCLKGINIYMITFGASEVNLSIVIKSEFLNKAVELLHSNFFNNINDNELFSEN